MKNHLLLFVFFAFSISLVSQETSEKTKIENEVNNNLWKPFKKAYEEKDSKKFNDLHTADVLRISEWSGIRVGNEYKEAMTKSFNKNDNSSRKIDFWFEQRFYSKNIGYEVGYYRVIKTFPTGETKISFARFHVVLKKTDTDWKIAQDWDVKSINGSPITNDDFSKGTPIVFN